MPSRKVLTVDDDLATRRLIKLVLELELDDVDVLEASDGKECLNIVNNQPVDLILLDVNMPGISGWDVLRILRSTKPLASIPTIIVSGEYPDPDLIGQLQPEGCFGKPFDVFELASCVRKRLQNGCSSLSSH